jgi:hypothetical protein
VKEKFDMSRISFLFFVLFLGITLLLFAVLPGPLAVRHADADAASVTLAWDPNTELDLAGYKLYYGTASGAYEFAIDVGNQTTYSISGFREGGDYYFAVTAYNAYGLESGFSDEVGYPGPIAVTIPLVASWNLISLPIEPINPAIADLTGQLSPCLRQVFTVANDTELYFDASQPDLSTLITMESGKGYWVEMACPGAMTVVGNRTTNPIPLTVGTNMVGYNSLIPIPVSQALASVANKYTTVWAYRDDQWTIYDPYDETWTTLNELSPGSGYLIDVIEETTWGLP